MRKSSASYQHENSGAALILLDLKEQAFTVHDREGQIRAGPAVRPGLLIPEFLSQTIIPPDRLTPRDRQVVVVGPD